MAPSPPSRAKASDRALEGLTRASQAGCHRTERRFEQESDLGGGHPLELVQDEHRAKLERHGVDDSIEHGARPTLLDQLVEWKHVVRRFVASIQVRHLLPAAQRAAFFASDAQSNGEKKGALVLDV